MIFYSTYFCRPDETASPLLRSFVFGRSSLNGKRSFSLPNWVIDYTMTYGSFCSVSDHPPVRRAPGSIHLYKPGIRFMESSASEMETESFSLQFSGGAILRLDSLLNADGFAALNDSDGSFRELMRNFCEEIHSSGGLRPAGEFLAAQRMLFRTAELLLERRYPPENAETSVRFGNYGNAFWLEKAKSLLDGAIGRKMELAGIAEKMHCGLSTFAHKFKALSGEAPGEFLMRRRVENADFLLRSGYSIKETARLLGFYDQFHFSKIYRQKRGVPPSGAISITNGDQIAGKVSES